MTEEQKQDSMPENPLFRIPSLLSTGPKAIILRIHDQVRRLMTGSPVWKYSRITPNLYIGGQHYARGWKAMQEEGITAIVNMRERWHDDVIAGVGGESHLHLATIDNTAVALEDMDNVSDYINEEISRGGKVYIHCGVGVGRAPSAAAAYFIKYKRMTTVEALARIRENRPFVHLTSNQRRRLEEFELLVREREQEGVEF